MTLLDKAAVTFQVVLTKADKVKEEDREKVLAQVRAALAKHPAAFPELVLTSSEKGDGIETLRAIIATLAYGSASTRRASGRPACPRQRRSSHSRAKRVTASRIAPLGGAPGRRRNTHAGRRPPLAGPARRRNTVPAHPGGPHEKAQNMNRDWIATARTLNEALPYLQRYEGATVVVKFGGNAMGDEEAMASSPATSC